MAQEGLEGQEGLSAAILADLTARSREVHPDAQARSRLAYADALRAVVRHHNETVSMGIDGSQPVCMVDGEDTDGERPGCVTLRLIARELGVSDG